MYNEFQAENWDISISVLYKDWTRSQELDSKKITMNAESFNFKQCLLETGATGITQIYDMWWPKKNPPMTQNGTGKSLTKQSSSFSFDIIIHWNEKQPKNQEIFLKAPC